MKNVLGVGFLYLALTANVLAVDPNNVTTEILAKTNHSWDGSELTAYPGGSPQVTILRITIPPGAQLPMHLHPVINAGVLLKGQLTVMTTQNKTLHLEAGNSIVEVVDRWHYGKNEGEIPAEIIVFYAGVKGQSVTIKK